ncbi:MAG: hypothetical protein O7G85_11725 [Planctomycetota bacterium]|nr:hypothetical protein [Planctomycetota bacterium]
MDDIRKLLSIARRKIETTAFLNYAHQVAVIVTALILVLMIVDKAPAQEFLAWTWILPSVAAVWIGIATWLWFRTRRSELQVALAVDERLHLREKISTALHCQGRDDIFAQAAIEDAVKTASDPKTREIVSRRFVVEPPRGWWISPMIILLALMASFLSPFDLFSSEEQVAEANVTQVKAEVKTTMDDLVKELKEKPQLSSELSDLIGDLTKDGLDPDAMRQSPKDIKRNAIKRVTDLNKKLDEILNGEKGKTLDSLEDALRQLKTPEDGPAKELADALSSGNFKAALEALDELKAKMKKGELSEEQKKKLEEQLNKMAEQLKKLSENQEKLEAALKKAGLDSQLANNPQALQQAIQNNPNLNEQQKQQLMQMAKAQQAANKMCQGLGQACQSMAQAAQNGEFGQGASKMGSQLSQMEAMSMLMQEANAMSSMCQGQCNKMGQGLAMKPGGAFGGRGRGMGGKAPLAPTPTGTSQKKANVKTQDGDIIARMLFDGPVTVGESKVQLKQVAAEATEGFDEALSEDQLPRRYHETQKHYFGELKKLTEGRQVEDEEEATSSESETTEAKPESGN